MPWAQGGRAFKSPRPDHPYVTDLFALFDFGAPSAPVANWGVLGFPEALTIYNFIYSRFPSTAGSGLNLRAARRPSPSSGCFVGRKGFAPGIGSLNTTALLAGNPSQLPRWRLPGRFGGANRGGAVSRPGAHENRSPACATRGGANPGEGRPLRRFNIVITVRYTRKGAVGRVSSVFTTAFTSVHSRLSFTTVVHNRLSFTTACRGKIEMSYLGKVEMSYCPHEKAAIPDRKSVV